MYVCMYIYVPWVSPRQLTTSSLASWLLCYLAADNYSRWMTWWMGSGMGAVAADIAN